METRRLSVVSLSLWTRSDSPNGRRENLTILCLLLQQNNPLLAIVGPVGAGKVCIGVQ